MNRVFADTSYYIALCNPKDPYNSSAISLSRRLQTHVVTTECVIVELGNFLCSPSDRALFLALAHHLRTDKHTTVAASSDGLLDEGIALYGARMDKGWSLTDCISFVVMRRRGLSDALSCDHHFEQAGFRLLLEKL